MFPDPLDHPTLKLVINFFGDRNKRKSKIQRI
jgi:hypothetical protein